MYLVNLLVVAITVADVDDVAFDVMDCRDHLGFRLCYHRSRHSFVVHLGQDLVQGVCWFHRLH